MKNTLLILALLSTPTLAADPPKKAADKPDKPAVEKVSPEDMHELNIVQMLKENEDLRQRIVQLETELLEARRVLRAGRAVTLAKKYNLTAEVVVKEDGTIVRKEKK